MHAAGAMRTLVRVVVHAGCSRAIRFAATRGANGVLHPLLTVIGRITVVARRSTVIATITVARRATTVVARDYGWTLAEHL